MSLLKNFRLLSLVLVAISTAGLLALITPANARAISYSSMSPTEKAKSTLYYNALGACIERASGGNFLSSNKSIVDLAARIKVDDVGTGKWFANPSLGAINPSIGYFLGDSGLSVSEDKVGCGGSNTDWILDALQLWGYQNPLAALCSFGFVRENESDCMAGSEWFMKGDTNLFDKFKSEIKSKVYAGGDVPDFAPIGNSDDSSPTPSPAAYVLYRNVLFNGCIGNTTIYTGAANDDFTYQVTDVDVSTGAKTTNKYYGKRKADERVNYTIDRSHNNIGASCGSIRAAMDYNASAYATLLQENASAREAEAQATPDLEAEDSTSCAIPGIGWILCPVINFLANIADGAFNFLSNSFLRTDPAIFNQDTGTYQGWLVMRDFANVAFVIAFLIIIFSQVTNIGIGNYGIKKLLPRLIIAAILVNLSYFICQIAVDLSNILGYSIKDTFDGFGQTVLQTTDFDPSRLSDGTTGGGAAGFFGGLAVTLLGVGVVAYAGLAAFIPILIGAVVALLMIFFILLTRQALIILLIVVAPLAFVAFLLPNTQPLFKKWQKAFTAMLLLFPIVSVVFGASNFAGVILSSTFGASLGDDSDWWGNVIAAAVVTLPLFIVPGILKKSLDGIGGLGAAINNIGKKLGDSSKKLAEPYVQSKAEQRRAARAAGEIGMFGNKRDPNKTTENKKYQALKEEMRQGKKAGESTDDWNKRRAGLIKGMTDISSRGNRFKTNGQTVGQRFALGKAAREADIARLKKQPEQQLKALANDAEKIDPLTGRSALQTKGYSRATQRLAGRVAGTFEKEELADLRASTVENESKARFEKENRTGAILQSKAAEQALSSEQGDTKALVDELKTAEGQELRINHDSSLSQEQKTQMRAASQTLQSASTTELINSTRSGEANRQLTAEQASEITGDADKGVAPNIRLQTQMAGIGGESGRIRAEATARANKSKIYKETVANQRVLDSRGNFEGYEFEDGKPKVDATGKKILKKANFPPVGSDHLARIMKYIDDKETTGSSDISDEMVTASIEWLGEKGGQIDIINLAKMSNKLDSDHRDEVTDVAPRKFTSTDNPALGGGNIAKIAKGDLDINKAYLEYTSHPDFTADKFIGWHADAKREFYRAIDSTPKGSKERLALKRIMDSIKGDEILQSRVDGANGPLMQELAKHI